VLFALLLLIPAAGLYLQAQPAAADRESAAAQELLGIDYARALQPLTTVLMTAQTDAVAGRAVNDGAVVQAMATVDAADGREGAALSLHDRWQGLRSRIQSLPGGGSAQSMYDAYHEIAELLLALDAQLDQTARLAADPQVDTFGLQRVLAVDLPQITVQYGQYVSLVALGSTAAQLEAPRQAVIAAGVDLVGSLASAVAGTSSVTLSGDLLGEVDGMHQVLDAVSTAANVNAAAAGALDQHLTQAATALSAKVLGGLDQLVGQRHDDARQEGLRSLAAVGLAVVLVVLYLVVEVAIRPRRASSTVDYPSGQIPVRHAGWEHVGAAR
jgi:hypothetical protein